jgi:hypothetical protein
MKTALICGAGGLLGHLVKKLKREGIGSEVDIKQHEFAPTQADEFLPLDLWKSKLSLPSPCPTADLMRFTTRRRYGRHGRLLCRV